MILFAALSITVLHIVIIIFGVGSAIVLPLESFVPNNGGWQANCAPRIQFAIIALR